MTKEVKTEALLLGHEKKLTMKSQRRTFGGTEIPWWICASRKILYTNTQDTCHFLPAEKLSDDPPRLWF